MNTRKDKLTDVKDFRSMFEQDQKGLKVLGGGYYMKHQFTLERLNFNNIRTQLSIIFVWRVESNDGILSTRK